MRLSTVIIARNEAARIARAIDSVVGLSDEVIVVDTGSTDDTADIARSRGAHVVPHVWQDDFAAARNAAIPHTRGRWTLHLDADEIVDRSTIAAFAPLLNRDDALGFVVVRRDYVGGFIDGRPHDRFVSSAILRVLRNDLGFHFTGRCHEQPFPWPEDITARTGLQPLLCPLVLDHDCDYYGAGESRKAARNSPLLEREIAERPDRPYWVIHCAASLLSDSSTAARGHAIMRRAVELVHAMRHRAQPPFSLVMLPIEYAASAPVDLDLPLAPDDALSLAERWFPNAAPTLWLRARRAYESANFAGAIPILRRLLQMGESGAYDLEVPFDHAIVGDDARLNLGACLLRQAELDEAERVLRAVDPRGPRAVEARRNLETIALLRKQFGSP